MIGKGRVRKSVFRCTLSHVCFMHGPGENGAADSRPIERIYDENFHFWAFFCRRRRGEIFFLWEDRGKETGCGINVWETPRGKFLKCDDRENKAARGRKQRCREGLRAIQIREARTAVKYSCAGAPPEWNWRIISWKALIPGSLGTWAPEESGFTCSKRWRTWPKYQKLHVGRLQRCFPAF